MRRFLAFLTVLSLFTALPAFGNSNRVLYIPWASDLNNPNTYVMNALNKYGFQVVLQPSVPSDLSDYGLVILESYPASNPAAVDAIKAFVQNGGGFITFSGCPTYLAGGDDLAYIRDWFGGAGYMNDGGYASVSFDHPFGTDLLTGAIVSHSDPPWAGAIYGLNSDSTLIASWSFNGSAFSFIHSYGQGRVFFMGNNVGWYDLPFTQEQLNNNIKLFEAGLQWAANVLLVPGTGIPLGHIGTYRDLATQYQSLCKQDRDLFNHVYNHTSPGVAAFVAAYDLAINALQATSEVYSSDGLLSPTKEIMAAASSFKADVASINFSNLLESGYAQVISQKFDSLVSAISSEINEWNKILANPGTFNLGTVVPILDSELFVLSSLQGYLRNAMLYTNDNYYLTILSAANNQVIGMSNYYKQLEAVLNGNSSNLQVIAHSPVDIVVTTADGFSVSKWADDVLGATYVETDLDGDGQVDAKIVIPYPGIGNYAIQAVPKSDALPSDTYSLEVVKNGISTFLAKDVEVKDAPSNSYTVVPKIPAGINMAPDSLDLKSKGKYVTCYIRLPSEHCPRDIILRSISLFAINGMLTSQPLSPMGPLFVVEGKHDDTRLLMVRFDRYKLVQQIMQAGAAGSTRQVALSVSGLLRDGTMFEGSASIRILDPWSCVRTFLDNSAIATVPRDRLGDALTSGDIAR